MFVTCQVIGCKPETGYFNSHFERAPPAQGHAKKAECNGVVRAVAPSETLQLHCPDIRRPRPTKTRVGMPSENVGRR